MPSDTRPFGDLFDEPTRNGLNRPKAVRGSGTKMVNMGELFAHSRISNVPMEQVPLSQSEARRFLLEEGDLLFARQSLVLEGAGKCSIFLGDEEPVTFESHVTRVRLDQEKAYPDYYYYYFQSYHGRSAIRSIVEQGAGASGIRGRDLATLDVHWRPLQEQLAIAHILGTLDDKIELNRRMNQNLEQMARALFKSWFVDFDPVRAKMEGRWRRGESLPGLPADNYDLFSDRLVPSELGEIPEGWAVKTLAEMVELNPREPLKRGTEAPYLDMASLPTSGPSPDQAVSREFKSGTRFRNNDTLLARITPCLENGKTAFIQSLSGDVVGWGSTEFIVMRAIPPIPPEYTYLLARDEAFREHSIQSMAGTSGRQRVQFDALASYLLPCPPTDVWAEFSSLVDPMFTDIEKTHKESHSLAEQRDAMLPILTSGELAVGTA